MKKAHRGIPGKDSREGTKKNHFHAEAHITTTFAREAAEKAVGAAPRGRPRAGTENVSAPRE
jgi:hypothetical protein